MACIHPKMEIKRNKVAYINELSDIHFLSFYMEVSRFALKIRKQNKFFFIFRGDIRCFLRYASETIYL